MTSTRGHNLREAVVYGNIGKRLLINMHNKDLEAVFPKILNYFDVILHTMLCIGAYIIYTKLKHWNLVYFWIFLTASWHRAYPVLLTFTLTIFCFKLNIISCLERYITIKNCFFCDIWVFLYIWLGLFYKNKDVFNYMVWSVHSIITLVII